MRTDCRLSRFPSQRWIDRGVKYNRGVAAYMAPFFTKQADSRSDTMSFQRTLQLTPNARTPLCIAAMLLDGQTDGRVAVRASVLFLIGDQTKRERSVKH